MISEHPTRLSFDSTIYHKCKADKKSEMAKRYGHPILWLEDSKYLKLTRRRALENKQAAAEASGNTENGDLVHQIVEEAVKQLIAWPQVYPRILTSGCKSCSSACKAVETEVAEAMRSKVEEQRATEKENKKNTSHHQEKRLEKRGKSPHQNRKSFPATYPISYLSVQLTDNRERLFFAIHLSPLRLPCEQPRKTKDVPFVRTLAFSHKVASGSSRYKHSISAHRKETNAMADCCVEARAREAGYQALSKDRTRPCIFGYGDGSCCAPNASTYSHGGVKANCFKLCEGCKAAQKV
ncbi:hypothetical protein B0T16DRAFT_387763 [Cercophora newfieldiana]|uniref:Uncharacterized protein n=1 Tax=Cercophora newfieldiana TaxID=92897 RepID=A0AA39YJ91_9PEZI|nr:hypothetical protein B0T16DRAFT_387763 [Cercophora newfieldiana]